MFAGHTQVLGGPHVARGPDVAQAWYRRTNLRQSVSGIDREDNRHSNLDDPTPFERIQSSSTLIEVKWSANVLIIYIFDKTLALNKVFTFLH